MQKNNNLKKIGNLNTKTFKKIIYKHLTELNLVAIFFFSLSLNQRLSFLYHHQIFYHQLDFDFR